MTYEEFRPQTLTILYKYHGVLRAWFSMEDLIQESWIAFLETGKRYNAKNNAHFFSLYRRVLKTRLGALCQASSDLRLCKTETTLGDEDVVDLADIIPDDGTLPPDVEAMLEELPFDIRLALSADIDNMTKTSRARRTTDEAIDEMIGIKGASEMIREALQ